MIASHRVPDLSQGNMGLWPLHVLARKNTVITWGYYFQVGIVLTVPVLLVTLATLAMWLSFQ